MDAANKQKNGECEPKILRQMKKGAISFRFLAVHSVNCKHAENNDEIVQQFKTVLALLIFRLNYLVHNCSDNRIHATAVAPPFIPFYLDGHEDRASVAAKL